MGPLWSGQGTVPHTTVSDLLSTDVIFSVAGAPVGARYRQVVNTTQCYSTVYHHIIIPSVMVVVKTSSDSLLLLPNTAATFTVQLLPGSSGVIVWLVAPPSGTICMLDIVDTLSHNRKQLTETV